MPAQKYTKVLNLPNAKALAFVHIEAYYKSFYLIIKQHTPTLIGVHV
jgi:hypothetical protein